MQEEFLRNVLTGVANNYQQDILSIGPNPVKDQAYFYLNFESDKKIEINVFDLTGRKIMEFDPTNYQAGKYYVQADFTNEQEGFYFVQVIENNEIITTRKLIKVD